MPKRKGYITRQAKRLTDGEINRRRFVMSALSAGVTMPTALSLASRAEAQTPKSGGTLRLALAEAHVRDSLDPLHAETAFTRLLAFARGNALTEMTAEGDVIGELADGFTSTSEHSRWHFDLRREVRFQNGVPFTAMHVAETLSKASKLLPHLQEIQVDGPHRMSVTLTRPDPDLPRRLADPRLIVVHETEHGPVGTGPYRLDAFHPGTSAALSRVSEYWKPGRAHIDAVEMRYVPDVSRRQQAIMTGEVDYAEGLDPRALALLHHIPEVGVLDIATGRNIALSASDGQHHLIGAVAGALPQKEIVDRLLLSHGAPGAPLAASGMGRISGRLRLGVIDSGVPRSLDIARLVAKRLEDAGWPVALVTDPAQPSDIVLHWRRAPSDEGKDESVTLAWANDLSAYRAPLTHAGTVAGDAENDGARLIERWWFA